MLNELQFEIETFFSAYAEDLRKFSAASISRNFNIPCMVLDNTSSFAFNEGQELEEKISGALDNYKRLGLSYAVPKIQAINKLTGNLLLVGVVWSYFNAEETRVLNCNYEYTLVRKGEDDLKIAVAISLNETERVSEFMKDSQPSISPS